MTDPETIAQLRTPDVNELARTIASDLRRTLDLSTGHMRIIAEHLAPLVQERELDTLVKITGKVAPLIAKISTLEDQLTALTSENQKLREALGEAVELLEHWGPAPGDALFIRDTARPLLKAELAAAKGVK